MKVVITSATIFEAERIEEHISKAAINDDVQVTFHVSGVGMLSSCYSITKLLVEQKPGLIIQVGIAGCFDTNIALGKVVVVKEDVVGDMGVEEDGIFKDLFDMKFVQENEQPFTNRKLMNPWLQQYNLMQLDEVSAITINEISTRKTRTEQLISKYNPVVESMEGAALHYACLQTKTPFVQVRAISNYVGERDKKNWKLNQSIANLTNVIVEYVAALKNMHAITSLSSFE